MQLTGTRDTTSFQSLLKEFESALQQGERPEFRRYLTHAAGSQRTRLLREMILIELWCRRDESPLPGESEYRFRFPDDHPVVAEAFELFGQRMSSVETMATAGQVTVSQNADDCETHVEDGSEHQRVRLSPGALKFRFGRYRLLRELGRGGMGTVYLAHDEQLDRKVALKIPTFQENDQGEMLTRFYREARAASALRDPGICPVYDVGEIDGQAFIAMAFIDGRPLRDYTEGGKSHDVTKTARVIRKLAVAMSEAHQANIVHRDLKPANIMMENGRRPVIMDFGLARSTTETESRLTGTGAILGTPTDMSSEQAMGETDRIGPATDIYSLGVIFYEMLAGRVPFEGNVTAVLTQIATADPKPLSEYGLDIDPAIVAVVSRMMARQMEDRFSSMDEVVSSLTACLKEETLVVEHPEANDSVKAGHAPGSQNLQSLSDAVCPPVLPQDNVERLTTTGTDTIHSRLRGRRHAGGRRKSGWSNAVYLPTIPGGLAAGIIILGSLCFLMFRPTTSDNRDTHDRGNSGGDPSRPSDGVRRTVPEPIYVNSIGMRFVPISPGTFTMGENETARKVTMGRAFHLGEYQVTQEQYEKVMGSNRNHSAYKGPQKPVENVAWAEAVEFCCKLSDSPDEKTAESVYRLPTEAEWEYACRAGTTTQYSFGDSDSKLGKYAWYSGNSSNTTHPVGQKKSNAWGLYDMHGNVQEWCQDYHEDDVTGDAVIDSTSPAKRLARGGSWNHSSAECRSTYPIQHDPDGRGPDLGFRVLRSSIR